METIHRIPNRYPKGEYLLLFDPLDGSSNIDVNVSIGTIFSVLHAPHHASGRNVEEQDFLQAGSQQVAAGYAVYGPQAMLVRSEEHTSELQSLMRISYAVFCLKKKTNHKKNHSCT